MPTKQNDGKKSKFNPKSYKIGDYCIAIVTVVIALPLAIYGSFFLHKNISLVSILTCFISALLTIFKWHYDRKIIELNCKTEYKYDDKETAFKLIKSTLEGSFIVFAFVCVCCGYLKI
ncbi:hypothetical protein AXE76_03615 [Gardnerella vaginalis]|uniref:Uncharacterized protein n=1 Tax=Gardnerella vaginalis TaxID=2702 RepID=A0A3E1IQN5_GARVA|nr:hypothetical protein [Bifidobacteriaceae bacterium NR043]MBF9353635.1 hypothetical protein [Bifidobacteriaceae bacterium NR044]RFD75280.1 hypothetical protein AXE76_03615 [Gardnerella vaginalis]RFT39616.1 hypothetical protein CG398_03375 [Bifidobacteriaceae bacterium NR003]